MFSRLVAVSSIAALGLVGLTACSNSPIGDNQTLHGNEAKAALVRIANDSVAAFKKDGGTEQVTLNGTGYGIIYDPTQPAGKRTSMVDISGKGGAQRAVDGAVFLLALPKLLSSSLVAGATYDYSASNFTVTTGTTTLLVHIANNLVNGTELTTSVQGGNLGTQDTIENYGISSTAKKQNIGATPAPSTSSTSSSNN